MTTPIYEDWTVVGELGKGGFGRVYEIQRENYGYIYKAALKVISVPKSNDEIEAAKREYGLTDDKSAAAYFDGVAADIVKELELMYELKGHSNIVSYEDHKIVRHSDGIGLDILIRMELLTPLEVYIREHELTRRDVIRLGIDICTALEQCQKFDIIHRDIKPANLFVSKNDSFKIGDFGIARTMEEHTVMDMTPAGTYNYMAPEILRSGKYGFSVDMYSLGLVMYRLLNHNRLPFFPPWTIEKLTAEDKKQALNRRFGGEKIPRPSQDASRLAEIILKACSFRPEDRYSSPTMMKLDLEAILYEPGDWDAVIGESDVLDLPESNTPSSGSSGLRARFGGNPDETARDAEETAIESGPEAEGPVSGEEKTVYEAEKRKGRRSLPVILAVVSAVVILALALIWSSLRQGADELPAETEIGAETIEVEEPSTPEPEPEDAEAEEETPGYVIETGDGGITIEKYLDENGNVISVQQYHADGTNGLSWSYSYDEEGRQISETAYHADGTVISETESFYSGGLLSEKTVTYASDGAKLIWRYEYDADDRLLEMTAENEAGELLKTYRYEYADDASYRETVIDPDGSFIVFAYDLAGNQVLEEDYDTAGELTRYCENKYDWKGRMTKQTWYRADGTAYGHSENSYDENGSTTKVTQYNADGLITGYILYETGPEGNTTVTFYTNYDAIISEQVFDEEGNLLQRTDFGQ